VNNRSMLICLVIGLLIAISSAISIALLYEQQLIIDRFMNLSVLDKNLLWIMLLTIVVGFCIKIWSVIATEQFLISKRRTRSKALFYSMLTPFYKKNIDEDFSSLETNLVEGITEGFDRQIVILISEVTISIAAYCYALTINRTMVLIALAFMILNLFINKLYGLNESKLLMIDQKNTSQFVFLNRNLLENFINIKSLKLNKQALNLFEKDNERYMKGKLSYFLKYSKYMSLNSVYYAMEKLFLIIFAVLLYNYNKITPGQLISSIFLSTLLASPLVKITEGYHQISSTSELRKKYKEMVTNSKSINNKGHISFEDYKQCLIKPDNSKKIYYDYYDKQIGYDNKVLMNDVKLTMFFGKHYLLIGDNGTGKSTLARQIFLDFKRQGYKAFFIDQFAPISKGTVRDNINWSGADEKDIKHLMGIFELDKNLRDHIERNGVNLSGGEKQKILLIRNLLAKPDILILDESLRMIDKKSKKHILEYITSLNDVTILYISHKLNKDEINLFDGIYLIQNQKLTYIDKESERWSLWDF